MKKVAAVVEKQKCQPKSCQHECMKYDPVNKAGGEGFHLGESGKSEISEEVVTEMHKICAKKCPFGAIHIINLPEKLNEPPVHSYGRNSFELFALPIIKENSVVGVIGRNGIGKSSALQILTGNIKPNLGDYKNIPTEEKIIERYSKVLFGDYFKKLFSHNLKISYKPQRVELLALLYKGHTVIELLKKVDEKGNSEKLLKELGVEEIKNRKIEQLSGGELQRVAIIAAAVKKADVYYFDEPTSFLDITYRIKVAKLIRELAKNVSIVVVEHDLATLDYISDEIQIVYGEPACYGIFSQSKSVRRGINEYMEGMMPEENIRFRNYPIRFVEAPEEIITSQEVIQEIEPLEKGYEGFKLKTSKSVMHKGEVMAIMGSNGLGKTTFLRLLAGIETPDNTAIEPLKISYKPQYLNYEAEGTVENYLRLNIGSDFTSGWFKTNILEKLNIKSILHNKVSELSGGELQKVYTVAALCKPDIDLIAMDEPSAFIDVEDRLNVAEIIKDYVMMKGISAIIVDHDIQFVDHLSDTMIVFEGIPGKEGYVYGPVPKREGMNRVLKNLDITYRRDKLTGRPRINKPGSQLDREQRFKGEYYYTA